MRREQAVAVARPVVVAAARILGVHSDVAWDLISGPASRRAKGQPPPEVTLVRSAVAAALFECGLPFMTATHAAGSRRRQMDGSPAKTVAAIVARLSTSAPAVLAAARGAARAAVRELLPPTAKETRAAARVLAAEEFAASGITEEQYMTPYDRRGAAVRRRIARRLFADGHTRRNIAASMGWSMQAVDHWVGGRRGDAVPDRPRRADAAATAKAGVEDVDDALAAG